MGAAGLAAVERLAARFAVPAGMEVVLVELVREQTGRILRVLLDKPGGITLDDCQYVAERLSRALDEEPPVEGPYSLEVSSPGIERPLVKRRDFERFAGSEVSVRVREAIDGRRRFHGRLVGLEGDEVVLETDVGRVVMPLEAVTKAHLVVDF